MTRYMARWTWTDADPGGTVLSGDGLRGIAVHWPGTQTPRYGTEPAGTVMGRIRAWRDYHVDGRGWSDIGYNFAIDQAGRVWELRGIDRVGAHCASDTNPDANHEWIGVLLILGASEAPSGAMVQAFRDFRVSRFLPRWPGSSQVVGHDQVYGAETACPGHHALNLINAGALTRPPRTETDDMTPEQMTAWANEHLREYVREANTQAVRDPGEYRDELAALIDERIRATLAETQREAADRDTKFGRHYGSHQRAAIINAGGFNDGESGDADTA